MYTESLYNYYIPTDKGVLYFNTLKCIGFYLTKKEDDNIQKLLKDPLFFELEYPTVFDKFIEWGFLYDDNKDEIDILRYKNRLATIHSKDYRLTLYPSWDPDPNFRCKHHSDSNFGYMNKKKVDNVKLHLKKMIEENHITALSIRWGGTNPINYYDKIIFPISNYTQKICNKHNLPFNQFINLNISEVNIDLFYKMDKIGINKYCITIPFVLKEGDKNSENDNLLEYYEDSLSFVFKLLNSLSNIFIMLVVEIDEIVLKGDCLNYNINNLKNTYKDRITISIKNILKQINYQKVKQYRYNKHPQLYSSCDPNHVFCLGSEYKCSADRKYSALINFDGSVYICPALGLLKRNQIGQLSNNGEIVFDEVKIANKLGKPTFENQVCIRCKHLPLCLGPCTQKQMYIHKDDLYTLCPLNNTNINPEKVIVEYYEKNLLSSDI